MITTSVGNPFGSVQIPHNYNTWLIHDLVLLLFQSLLIFLGILREIHPVVDTTAEPSIAAGDSDVVEHTVQLEHNFVVAEESPSNCTATATQIVDAVQIVVAVQTMAAVVGV